MKPKIKKILKIAGEVIILALVLGCFFYSLYKVIIYAARENLKFSLPWVKGAYFEIVAPPNPPAPPTPPAPPCPPPCCVSPIPTLIPTPTGIPSGEPSPTPTATPRPSESPVPTPTPTQPPAGGENGGTGGVPFQLGGPPPPPPVTGQVLGVTTLGGTGVAEDTLFSLIFILGCLATSLGIRKIATAQA